MIRLVDVDQIQQRNTHSWTLDACLDQLYETLSFVKSQMPRDGVSLKFTAVHGTTYVSPSFYGDYIVPANFLRIFPF
uniref:Uncharacterized protein n=1 Tax=Caenorhabditis japonica TaxID=281687 RepID=K7HIU7_CAEJA